jgi:hypothetical protein
MICVFQVVDYSKALALTEKNNTCTRKNAQVVTSRQRTCSSNKLSTGCVRTACSQFVDNLLYKVVALNRLVTSCSKNVLSSCNSTICQQVASANLVATWKITALLQLVYKLATSLLRTHLDKLWDCYVCTQQAKGNAGKTLFSRFFY